MIGVDFTNANGKEKPTIPCLAMRMREAALALNISERLLWEWTDRKQVPHVRIGKAILYPVDSLKEWLKQVGTKNHGYKFRTVSK
jgi:excisionase family DNA binding protein